MQRDFESQAEACSNKKRHRRIWKRIVGTLACVVVFCTTYALVLPAITMEGMKCGMEEHTHSMDCYVKNEPEVLTELSCSPESLGCHVHSDSCKDADGNIICGYADYIIHTHNDNCYDSKGNRICELEEKEEHVHTDECYEIETVTSQESAAEETAGESGETVSADSTETANTEASEDNTTVKKTLICTKEVIEEHKHTEECYDEDNNLICGKLETIKHVHEDSCFQKTEEAIRAETLTCGLKESDEHQHTALCYGDWELVCGLEEHTHTEECYPEEETETTDDESADTNAEVSEEVQNVITLIDEMPSADEIDAKMKEFEDAEDYEGEEAWLTEVYQQVARTYHIYDRLSEEQKAQVTNADKLLELEYIWSATTYEATNTIPVYQVNYYYPKNLSDSSVYAAILVYGGSFDSVVQDDTMADMAFDGWDAIVVEEDDSGNLYIAKYDVTAGDKSTLAATTDKGFVLIFTNDSTHGFSLNDLDFNVGDYVSIDFNYTTKSIYTGTAFGTVTISEETFKEEATGSNDVDVVEYASTKDFVELNLYNYYGSASAEAVNKTDINTPYYNNSKNVGFQWNGGAYPAEYYNVSGYNQTWCADRNVLDCVDFGNSLIKDYTITAYDAPGSGNMSTGAILATKGADGEYNTSDDGYINWIHNKSIANKPIGLSTFGSSDYSSVVSSTLQNGYPALTQSGATESSLEYLFTDSEYAKKVNTQNIDGLFQQDTETGEYYFNSRWNHAQFNSGTNRFVLYDQIITPNFILYPFGNFLPFNDITDSNTATLIGSLDQAREFSSYIEKNLARLKNSSDYSTNKSKQQLWNMLNSYKINWQKWKDGNAPSGYENRYWSSITAMDALNDYFNNSTGELPVSNWYDSTHMAVLNKMYNIDYDVEKDFFFGMEMKMNFYQPKDGLTGNDNNDDNIPDYNMEFYFTGDDDVWVYIDDILFLDLTGIHRHVGGKIDFVNGKVYYYALNASGNGDVDINGEAYYEISFAEILTEFGGIDEDDLDNYLKKDSKDNYTTFIDYSTHSFKFYYMERGSGSSVCRINFNFPLIKQNTIAVEKLLADSDTTEAVESLGNPDFTFQVLDAKTNENFLGDNWAYSLYDVDGSVIQEIKVTEKYPDGRIKSMTIKDGNGNTLCTETYDSDGNLTERKETGRGEVLRIDSNGCFTLKAGQKAEFVGIKENLGEYYVRELLPESLQQQYGSVSVSGTTATKTEDNVMINKTTFIGQDSTVQDSHASNSFEFTNTIDTSKLGALSISKTVTADYSKNLNKEYEFNITLDDELLPEGLEYIVKYMDGDTEKTDTRNVYYVYLDADGKEITNPESTAGLTLAYSCIKLKHGETATIPNILAGTVFEITETSASAKGYTVGYKVGNDVQNASSATGTIGLESTVSVEITNSEVGTKIKIPIWKNMAKNSTYERDFTFAIQQVTDMAGETTVGTPTELTIEKVASEDKGGVFELNYLSENVTGTSQTFYYKIYEVAGTESKVKYDDTYYIVEVMVTKSDNTMAAEVSAARKYTIDDNGNVSYTSVDINAFNIDLETELNKTPIVFTNVIVRTLTLSKTVLGSEASKNATYKFTVKLEQNTSGIEMPEKVSGTLTKANKTTESVSYTVTDWTFTVELMDGESLTLKDMALGLKYTVTEETSDGFKVTYTVTTGNNVTNSDSETVEGTVGGNNITVACTNTQGYEIPEAGGIGTRMYTMVGLMLMFCSTVYLLYRLRKHRREVT